MKTEKAAKEANAMEERETYRPGETPETDQLSRIRYYEEKLDRCTEAIIRLQEALTEFDDAQADLKELERYYTSEDWRRDFEDDEAGLWPEGLKRGVLSEDGIWDAREENAAPFGRSETSASREIPSPRSQKRRAPFSVRRAEKERGRVVLEGEVPSPINAPSGCPFHPRCKYATEACKKSMPPLTDISGNHLVACHNLPEK